MKKQLQITFPILFLIFTHAFLPDLAWAQVGYHNAPYVRYEANVGTLTNATATAASYSQGALQSEASEQVCVNMSSAGASVVWTVSAAGDGLVVRYSVPDGQSGTLDVYANGAFAGTLNLSSNWSWEYLWSNGNPNNVGVTNTNPKMRFDEVRLKLPSQIPAGGTLRLTRTSGNVHVDFAELEPVPAAVGWSAGNVTYSGDGSDLQNFIDNNGGATIYLPAGVYNVNRELYFGQNNTVLKGAGMWYTQIHFTNGSGGQGGLRANAYGVSYSGLYLTTVRNSRSNSYKAINGVYTGASTITNVWAVHFECGAWIGQYNAGAISQADGFTVSHCRFRNNYADGINLCKGTRNTIVEYCSFRNNGDDDMAIWSANGQECQNNTFRYCTSENTWRASGCAIYGGYNNKAHNLLIQDNLEVGIRVNNTFPGVGFNGGGLHEFYNIIIKRCGTYNDLYYAPVAAIDIVCTNVSGTRINNVKFSCISILDSKNDAIYLNRKSGEGFYNVTFENITVNGTGREFPNNDANNVNGTRGYGLVIMGSPSGNGTYCNMAYSNRGGNAPSDVNTSGIGSFSWTAAGSCPGGCILNNATTITSASTFGVCDNPVTLTATTTIPSGNTVSYVEFFVGAASLGQDNSAPYSINWNNPAVGNHTITATAHYTPSGSTTSGTQTVTIADGVYTMPAPPAIDGTVEAAWTGFSALNLNTVAVGTVSSGADLTAYYKIARDNTNLYILVDVTDDDLRNDSGNNWEDDAIELFIDMGNDKSGSYGANDYAYTFAYNDATVYETAHNATAGVTFSQGAKAGGYIMEIRIPWSTISGAPGAGTFMGIDVHVNDDDGGGTREAKKTWYDATDNAWQAPSALGTLQIAGCSNPLPVELLSFSGTFSGDNVVLNWQTISETNNHEFIIERSSDAISWIRVGSVQGSGNSSSLKSYDYVDEHPLGGVSYYRLRQEDVDGSAQYSPVISVQNAGTLLNVVNPFQEELVMYGVAGTELKIEMFDIMGHLVWEGQILFNVTSASIAPEIPAGTYLMQVYSGVMAEQIRLVKY